MQHWCTWKWPGARTTATALALSAKQELSLGRQAYQEILREIPEITDGEGPRRVQDVGRRIVQATKIEPLQREINLAVNGYAFEWEFKVLNDKQANAFCLP